jgi:hypothetical protein
LIVGLLVHLQAAGVRLEFFSWVLVFYKYTKQFF